MARRKKLTQPGTVRHFIRQWRDHRGLTQERLADRVDLSVGAISQLENGIIPYTQATLEAIASALSCEPADLIMRDPTKQSAIWSIWDQATSAQRQQIEAVALALIMSKPAA
jgi:transcriptional regulator with XRE-family HTH domain